MKTQTSSLGICRDAVCAAAGFGPVERYEGPGMFCPNCGELLQAFVPEAMPKGVKQAEPRLEPRELPLPAIELSPAPASPVPPLSPNRQSAAAPKPKSRRPSVVRGLLVWAAVLAVVAAVSVIAVAGVMDHSRAQTAAATLPTIGVCGTSMSDRLAADIAAVYAAQPQASFKSFELRSANCDVQFFAALDQPTQSGGGLASAVSTPVAHDGIVAIVNPQNPITSLSIGQLRGIFAGGIHNWARVRGGKGEITVYLADSGTDESRIVTLGLLKGVPVGSTVVRLASSRDVVRAVAAANGRNAIGMVPFSAAEPGKVLAIQHFPPPSTISIADRRYPLALSVRAWSASGAMPQFLAYATSRNAQAVAVRDGFVP
jgi:ABC-type phosphate transport system substrate-binding protein